MGEAKNRFLLAHFLTFSKKQLIKLIVLVKLKLTILVKGVDGDEIDKKGIFVSSNVYGSYISGELLFG
jgi:hypothetical protein